MPLRLPCAAMSLTPGSLLSPYWGPSGIYRPRIDVFAIAPGGLVDWVSAQIDCASDFVVLESSLALSIGLSLPFARQQGISGAAGTQAAMFSFAPDGLVSLFVTDYREYAFLGGSLVGFHPPAPVGTRQRSVLGLTGFLQVFKFVLDPEPTLPFFELHPITAFPGQHGMLPRDRPLLDFIRSLRVP
jgi:hypothetical protein